jgi:D-alanine-D-alanine ligase
VLAALRSSGVDAYAFDPRDKPLEALHAEGFKRAFIALHGRGGEDGTLQGALDLLVIPYTGSGVLASALAMDKWRSKLIWQATGLPVPDYVVLDDTSDFAAVEARLGLPLFVKPSSEGSSIGISKVKNAGDLRGAYELAAGFDSCVIAEQYLAGGEFTIGILAGQALPVIRIVPATEFYDYEAKYLRDDTEYRIPSGLGEEREREMRNLALRAFAVLGGRGWGRMDLMLDAGGRMFCLEANTSPGMTDHSLVPMAAKSAGIPFAQLVVKLLEEAACG